MERRHSEEGLPAHRYSLFMLDQSEWYGDVLVVTKASMSQKRLNTYHLKLKRSLQSSTTIHVRHFNRENFIKYGSTCIFHEYSWASVETSAIWITPTVTQRETPCALHCPPVLANVAAGAAFQLLGDTHAEVSYSCSCQLMEATQGNRKPCEEWTHRGGAEIFYKARRNVPAGNRDKEEKRCKVAFCWYIEHLSEVASDYSILWWCCVEDPQSIQDIYHHIPCFILYLLGLARLQDCVSADFCRWCDSKS